QDEPTLAGGVIVGETIQRFALGGVIVGCLSSAAIIAALALILDRATERPKGMSLCLILAGSGVFLGFSRQALLSLLIGMAIIAFDLLRLRQIGGLSKTIFRLVVIGAAAVGVLYLLPGTWAYVRAFAGRAMML